MSTTEYKSGDESAILELFKSSFKKEMSLEFWKWRFKDNPINKTMIKLMWDNDLLVGHYAVSPIEMTLDGKETLTALSMTTMTHPDYGGRGIFSTLAEELYQEIVEKHNVVSVWGFPNNNSHYGFIKNLKWKDLAVIPTLSLKVQKYSGGDNNNGIRKVEVFKEGHYETFNKVTNEFKVRTNRTVKYLTWRYIDNPVNQYEIFELSEGGSEFFAVTKLFPSFTDKGYFEVDIVENSFPHEPDAVRGLINLILETYAVQKISKINTWLPLGDRRHIVLEKVGFAIDSPMTYLGIRSLDDSAKIKMDIRNWYYSMGDSDIF